MHIFSSRGGRLWIPIRLLSCCALDYRRLARALSGAMEFAWVSCGVPPCGASGIASLDASFRPGNSSC